MAVTGEHEIIITDDYLCRRMNLNGVSPVDFKDFSILANNWLQTGFGLDGDIKKDGIVDFVDLMVFTECWLKKNN